MRIYIAAPFFTPHQAEMVRVFEIMLSNRVIKYFSPRQSNSSIKYGNLQSRRDKITSKVFLKRRKELTDEIFKVNIDELDKCDIVLAWIDDRDTGVIFEIGVAHKLKKIIIPISFNERVNIMVGLASACYITKFGTLQLILDAIKGYTTEKDFLETLGTLSDQIEELI